MQVITEAKDKIIKIWGTPDVKNIPYREMKYVLREDYDDKALLHNVVTGEMICLNQDDVLAYSKLPGELNESLYELVKKHFVVPFDFDEKKSVSQIRKMKSLLESKKEITGFTILPTTYCNARCFYCYERDFKHVHMSEQTANDVVDFILEKSKRKKISLQWFGGEPLVGEKIITYISQRLIDEGIEFSSIMTSNGYLFDSEMVKKAHDLWKVKRIQITLDGTEEIYNSTKKYVGVMGNPYNRVLNNIQMLLDSDITVNIRLNLDTHNEEDLKTLIVYLLDRFSSYEKAYIYVHRIFEDEGFEPISHDDEERKHLYEKEVELNSYIEKNSKYRRALALPELITTHCMADNAGSVIIHPGGELVKCEHCRSDEKFGTIYEPESVWDKNVLKKWSTHVELPECTDCPIYPACVLVNGCELSLACPEQSRNWKIESLKRRMLKVYSSL